MTDLADRKPFWRQRWFALLSVAVVIGIVVLTVKAINLMAALYPEPTYDHRAPTLPTFTSDTRILIFTKTNGFRHIQAIPASHRALQSIAAQLGWDSFVTENAAVHNQTDLSQFDLVVWSQVSGDVLTSSQRQVFKSYVETGGVVLAIHGSGGDPSYSWSWYPQEFIRAQFIGHPMFPQLREATMHIEERNHPATQHLNQYWTRSEEWYSFAKSPRPRVTVLATVNEQDYAPDQDLAMGADHPLIWHHKVGQGTVFYTALGHRASAYQEPEYRQLLKGAMQWLLTQRIH